METFALSIAGWGRPVLDRSFASTATPIKRACPDRRDNLADRSSKENAMTLTVIASFVAKPGFEQRLEQLFCSVVDATLREEGCIHYQINRDIANPRRLVFTEEWRSAVDLDRHLAAPHMRALSEQVPECLESADVLKLERLAGGAAHEAQSRP
jgi:quinol monooxygenase YgiN